jgi:glucose/arabinose dehydrogenase
MVETSQGHLLIGLGDRGTGPGGEAAQDLRLSHGKIIALSRAGEPLALAPGLPRGVLSYGHRNIQGAALDAHGTLWVSEHGARGGDEINRIRPGGNYGWPVISYGRNYNGMKIGIGTQAPGMEQPVLYWDPSIAPSGLVVLKGGGFAGWNGSLLAGSLKDDHIVRIDPATGFGQEVLRAPEMVRVRDLREAPDGSLWFLSVGKGALYRLSPLASKG